MSSVQLSKRRQELIFTAADEMPTVPEPPELAWGDNGFLSTDILIGEFAINIVDRRVYSRDENGIFELATVDQLNNALSAFGTSNINNQSSIPGSTLTVVLNILYNLISDLEQSRIPFNNIANDLSSPDENMVTSSKCVADALSDESLEQVRSRGNQLGGDIDFNNHQASGMRNASSNQEAATFGQLNAGVTEAKSYADSLVVAVFRPAGDWDASLGSYPTTGTGPSNGIRRGDTYKISVAGIIAGFQYDVGDTIYAIIATPGQSAANWGDFEHNTQNATEGLRGTAQIATAVEVADENSLVDGKFVSPKKLWANFWTRVLALAWTWAAKQTFTSAPRFSSANVSEYLKTNATKDLVSVSGIPVADISGLGSAATKNIGTAANTVMAGDDSRVSGVVYSIKANDTATASTSMIDVSGMLFTVEAGKSYDFEFRGRLGGSATQGGRLTVVCPAGCTIEFHPWGNLGGSGTSISPKALIASGAESDTFASAASGQANYTFFIKGIVTVGITAGDVKLQAKSMSGSNVFTVYANAVCFSKKIN